MVLPLAWAVLQDESSIVLVSCDLSDSMLADRYPSALNEFRVVSVPDTVRIGTETAQIRMRSPPRRGLGSAMIGHLVALSSVAGMF